MLLLDIGWGVRNTIMAKLVIKAEVELDDIFTDVELVEEIYRQIHRQMKKAMGANNYKRATGG